MRPPLASFLAIAMKLSDLAVPSSGRRYDLACLGRLAVDLYAQQLGCRLEDVASFAKYLGGSSANIAFDDHPSEQRFADRIETVTVDSVLAWLPRAQLASKPVVFSVKY